MESNTKGDKRDQQRKADDLAQNPGSTANILMERRKAQAKRLEEITGIKQK